MGNEINDKAIHWLKTAIAFDNTAINEESIRTIMRRTIAPTVDVKGPANDRARVMLNRVNSSQRLVLGEILGEGGMGIVRSARQADLGRDVAVKMLRKEVESSETTASMLREAWVTGTLEHPNVVPVYYVDTDEEGAPRIILKRVEGVAWSTLIGNASGVQKRFGASDLLEWNLGVLEKVIDAIRYSHSRGILHRDLKPDNVMVGAFGEVYVVDWGIAVSLKDDGETLLPIASQIVTMAGTPAFMAPEMLGDAVDERTDVYLLGSILYQIITERPPHLGKSIEEIIDSVCHSRPTFPADAPVGLCEISRKAMSRVPADRFQDAETMGRVLREFSHHRNSLRLSKRAVHLLDSMLTKAARGASPDFLQDDWVGCRFGFQSALEAWSENPEAEQGLHRATELVAEVELKRGDPRVAASILRDLDSPSPHLANAIGSAVSELDEADARMAKLGQQLDKHLGQRTRVLILSILGITWIGMELWGQLSGNIDRLATHQAMVIGSFVSLASLGMLVFVGRNALMKTVINRQFAFALAVLLASQMIISAVAGNIGLSPQQVQVLWILIWTVIAGMVATTVEHRTWPLAVGTAISFVVAGLWIEYRIYAMMGATAAMIFNGAAIWWPQNEQTGSNSNPKVA